MHGSTFYNNRRTAQFLKYQNVVNGHVVKDLSFFRDNKFIVDNNIPTIFEHHITMWGVNGVELTGNTFVNNQNLTLNHKSALYTIDASYKIDDNLGYQANSKIQKFYEGVHSDVFSLTSLDNPIEILNTDFEENEISIALNNLHYPTIRGNNIMVGSKQTPYISSASHYYSLGTIFRDVSNFVYCSNAHTKPYNTFQVDYTAGLEIHNCGEPNQQVEKNSFVGLHIGTDVDEKCGSDPKITGINFRWNTNSSNIRYDYIFQDKPIIRPIQSGDLGSKSSGNTFTIGTSVTSWYQVLGGNTSLVKYYYQSNNALHKPNINSFNVNLSGTLNISTVNTDCERLNISTKVADGLLTTNDLNDLKSEFTLYETSYSNYKVIYDELIDNGNTESTVATIQNSYSSEAMQLRADMLAMSPYVSTEVLQSLAEQNIFSNAILFEIIMANPDASRNTNFIDYLQYTKQNAFPNYMISMIENSWDYGATARTALEANLVSTNEHMTSLRNSILITLKELPDSYSDLEYYNWLSKVPSLRNSYEMIEFQLNIKNYTQADGLLEDLTNIFPMEETDILEYNAYSDLYNFKKSLLQNEIEINQLDSPKIASLKLIADNTNATFARSMARNALCFFYNICYPEGDREFPPETQARKVPSTTGLIENKEIIVYPNPAKEYVAFYFNLKEKKEVEELNVFDLTGKPIFNKNLNSAQGQYIWDTRSVANGNYIYTISSKNGEKYSGKITIEK